MHFVLAAGLVGGFGLPVQSQAQTSFTWVTETVSSGTTAYWGDGANWVGGTPPAASGTYNLDFSNETITTATRYLSNNLTGLKINQMTLGRSTTSAAPIILNGSAITWVKDGLGNDPQLTLNLASSGQNWLAMNSSIGAGVTLQINGTGNGNINLAALISGAGGVNYNKAAGVLLFGYTAGNTFSGDFTLTAGQIALGSSTTGTPGNVTAGPLGTGNFVINGGIIRVSGATPRTIGNNVKIGGNFQVGIPGQNTSLSLTGNVVLTGTGVTRTITGAFDAFSDPNTGTLTFSGGISEEGGGNGITFATSGAAPTSNHFVLGGVNTYTGNTTINVGTLLLADDAGLKFVIGANGVNNQILGTGTLQLNGDFTFDLTGAGTMLGDSWNIVNVATLTETFGSTFSVVGFTDNLDNTWSKINGGITYKFTESSGMLEVIAVPEPSTWALLASGLMAVTLLRRRAA